MQHHPSRDMTAVYHKRQVAQGARQMRLLQLSLLDGVASAAPL